MRTERAQQNRVDTPVPVWDAVPDLTFFWQARTDAETERDELHASSADKVPRNPKPYKGTSLIRNTPPLWDPLRGQQMREWST